MTIQFINGQNKDEVLKEILKWLETDFNKRGKPENHFWGNKSMIKKAFNKCQAMVVLNDRQKTIGYMIWSLYGGRAHIDIVEVKKDYRKQGIFKEMLSAFSDRFPEISVLSVSPLPEAEEVFSRMGWESIPGLNGGKRCFQIVRAALPFLDVLPNGCAIAVFSKTDSANHNVDYYQVKKNPSNYSMKYFQIALNENGELREPIVVPFHYEGYIGIYLDRKLIAEDKAKYLFKNIVAIPELDLLIIDKIKPCKPGLFTEFFSKGQSETTNCEASSNLTGSKVSVRPGIIDDSSERPRKRQRIGSSPTFFQLPQPETKKERADVHVATP